jgi:hypothetical protein
MKRLMLLLLVISTLYAHSQHSYVTEKDVPYYTDSISKLLGRYEENAYLCRMMKLAGHQRTKLYELQGFDHGGMAVPAFPLLLKEVAAIKKGILEKR